MTIAIGSNFAQQRPKLQFRPPPEWFANLQPLDRSPNYSESDDEPFESNQVLNQAQFPEFYFNENNDEDEFTLTNGNKLVRHIDHMDTPVFKRTCPTVNWTVTFPDKDYQYLPSSYLEVKCKNL